MNEQQTILNFLASIWPESASAHRIFAKAGTKGRAAEKAIQDLSNAGRIEVKPHAYFNGYRLTHAEAVVQGVDMGQPTKSSTEPVYSRATYKPPIMAPARHDADDAMKVFSRSGDRLIPATRPVSMVSSVRGGA